MNISDSERIRTVIESMGYEETEIEEEADLLGIVACSVRQKSIDRVYHRIHLWNSWKRERSLITFVSGCILPADREKFLDRFDLLFSIQEVAQLPDMIRQYGVATAASVQATRDVPDIRDEFWKVSPSYRSNIEAYVPIQNGCDKFCTFCAVPYTRGREVSRPSEHIVAEVTSLIERGFRSITLLGQNVNSYGLDRQSDEVRFSELLDRVGRATAGHNVWVYFTSPHPRDMTDDVLETIAAYPTLAKQIHLPIQSGDDEILARMNRAYTLNDYRRVVENIRGILPTATLFTDIIVGFTGETEEQFERTRMAMEEFAFSMAYIAMYSPRPGAAGSRWDDDIPPDEKKRRYHELSKTLISVAGERTAAMVGTHLPVLVTGHDRKGHLSGYSEGRLPVRIEANSTAAPGAFVDVTVTSARPLSIAGKAS